MRLEFLLKDYEEGGNFLTRQGFNGNVLELEPTSV